MSLTTVILTFNEERHIGRAIESVREISDEVVVVDSGSADHTREIAAALGARVLQNAWKNHATQFNWALDQLPPTTDWVLRLDADEIVTPSLRAEIARCLPHLAAEIGGVYLPRRTTFLGRTIRYGGVFPVRILRLFRHGRGRCEDRWMDEHILVNGGVTTLNGEILDDNLQSLSWWTQKHNTYASHEVVDLLNLEYRFRPYESVADLRYRQQAGVKRWIKERLYTRLPSGVRAFVYFMYRYVVRLGFLDGKEGTAFHFLQGFWYRYLVDIKLHEVKTYMRRTGVNPAQAIEDVLGVRVN